MKQGSFKFMQDWLKSEIGLNLVDGKEYLIEASLGPLVIKFELHDLDELVHRLKAGASKTLAEAVKDAMTVNETYFFRDKAPFEYFDAHQLPQLIEQKTAAGDKSIRIWCAAASTGQEPYSLAMIIAKHKACLSNFSIDIVGTDISAKALDKAKVGAYSQFEVQRGMPIQYLIDNFVQEGANWNLKPSIKQMVTFRPLNLLAPFSNIGSFDLIFCRNVLFYFDKDGKAKIVQKLSRCLNSGGFLVLGSAETLMGMSKGFAPLKGQPGYFEKQGKEQAVISISTGQGERFQKVCNPAPKPEDVMASPSKEQSKTLIDLNKATKTLIHRMEQRKAMRSQ